MIRTSKQGFTLIELIVVIFVLGITLVFAMPRFQDAMQKNTSKDFSLWLMLKAQSLKQKALKEKKLYTLHIGLDSGKAWMSNESMTEEAVQDAEENGYSLSEDLRIVDVEYPVKGKISFGRADIYFYKGGYSDKVLIHLEDEDNNQFTFLVEPFLSKIKRFDEYIGFEE